jgi:hypothetical protein
MTIKQQGGVFGRNPTFNNVEVDGTATLDSIAASDKLRVTASDNPAAYIELENTFQNAGIASQAGLLLGVNSSVQTNYAGVIGTESAPNSNGVELDFYANNGSAMVHVARARGSKNFEIMDGNLIVASGHGIDFSATAGTGTSELFDDYEEGTWTPAFDTSNGDLTSGYATQSGSYTKIGNVVNCHGALILSSVSGGTGTLVITGLPYSASVLRAGSTGFVFNFATNYPKGYLLQTATSMGLYYEFSATTYAQMGPANLNTDTQLYFFVSYLTA